MDRADPLLVPESTGGFCIGGGLHPESLGKRRSPSSVQASALCFLFAGNNTWIRVSPDAMDLFMEVVTNATQGEGKLEIIAWMSDLIHTGDAVALQDRCTRSGSFDTNAPG